MESASEGAAAVMEPSLGVEPIPLDLIPGAAGMALWWLWEQDLLDAGSRPGTPWVSAGSWRWLSNLLLPESCEGFSCRWDFSNHHGWYRPIEFCCNFRLGMAMVHAWEFFSDYGNNVGFQLLRLGS